jgi:endoglucanase
MREAGAAQAVPVFVAYNIPFRDSGSYSAGGAQTTADYEAWVDGLAAGLGDGRAVVLVEPDALGLITDLAGETAQQERYAQLRYAASQLERRPNVSVYLDGTHSAWLSVEESAGRLVRAGVEQTRGFYLNLSDYQRTTDSIDYGTLVSGRIASLTGGDSPAAHFVIDTSRNGRGPIDMSVYAKPPYNQSASTVATLAGGAWCNDPAAGLGVPPTADTGVPLLDAYLWIKTPGESDGQANAAGGARAWDYSVYSEPGWPTDPAERALFDPLWGLFGPPAGDWFPELALSLIRNSTPSIG